MGCGGHGKNGGGCCGHGLGEGEAKRMGNESKGVDSAAHRPQGHDHSVSRQDKIRSEQRKVRAKLVSATVFAVIFMVIEIVGGVLAGSLAIVTDAAHLFTDVGNFISAIIASYLAEQPASSKHSYGMVRAEVLSALINTGVIVLLAAYLCYEGVRRIMSWIDGTAKPIDGKLMMIIACVGVVFNIALLAIFGHEHGHGHGHDHGHSHGHSHSHSHPNSGGTGYQTVDGHDDHEHHHHEHGVGHEHHHDHEHDEEKGNGHHNHPSSHQGGEGARTKLLASDQNASTAAQYGSLQSQESWGGTSEVKSTALLENLNLQAAHLHVITDLVQSIGVAIAGVIIYFKPTWQIVDPAITIVFSLCIVISVIKMLAKTTHVLLEGVPEGVDPERLRGKLRAIPGVTDVHDLHVWMLSVDRPVVTVHIKASDPDETMKAAHRIFMNAGIDHVTVQIQKDACLPNECDHPCPSQACITPGNCGHPEDMK